MSTTNHVNCDSQVSQLEMLESLSIKEKTNIELFIDTPFGKKAQNIATTIVNTVSIDTDAKKVLSYLQEGLANTTDGSNQYNMLNVVILALLDKFPLIVESVESTTSILPSFISAFKQVTSLYAMLTSSVQHGETWNGDINYSTMGNDVWSLFMEMSNKNVNNPSLPIKGTGTKRKGQKSMSANFMDKIPHHIVVNCTDYMGRIFTAIRIAPLEMQSIYLDTLWRLVFYERAIASSKRVGEGKGNKSIFYLLFTLIAKEMQESAINMCHLIPHYGYMKDILYLLVYYVNENNNSMVTALVNVFLESIDKDIRTISPDSRGLLIRNGATYSMTEYKEFIDTVTEQIKDMSPSDIKDKFPGHYTMAGKYWPRPDTSYSKAHERNEKRDKHGKAPLADLRKRPFSFLNDLLSANLFFPQNGLPLWNTLQEKSRNFHSMLVRKTVTLFNKILGTVEVSMSGNKWGDINPKSIPGAAFFKHRLAIQNEIVGGKLSPYQSETGNRTSDVVRIDLRKRTLAAAEAGDIKFTGDCIAFAKECMKYEELNIGAGKKGYKNSISSATRLTLNSQFNSMVEDHRFRITKEFETKVEQWVTMGSKPEDEPLNPLYCAFITDVSGSMGQLIYYAVVLALIGIKLSKLTKGSITFSSTPSLIELEEDGDFVSWFQQIAKDTNWGGSTNIEAAFKMLLKMMKAVRTIDSTFNGKVSLTIFSDMMFDPRNGETGQYGPFVERMTNMFTKEGFHLPLTCFWNMNGNTPGFPVQADTPGIISAEGLSSGMFMSALGGGVNFKKDEKTGITTAETSPVTSFLKRLSNSDYNKVSEQLYHTMEGPFSDKLNVVRNQIFFGSNQ